MSGDRKEQSQHIRVITRIPGSHPELLADLSALPARDRPERLRLLASIGLALPAKRAADTVADNAPASKAVQDQKTEERRAAFRLLAASIRPD
jgi:hypothetical protein